MFQQFPSYQTIGSKAYKPTLENTLALAELFNNPQNDLKFIHVAGSNGKGSVCSIVSSALTEAGYKVGLFTSPHIYDFTERIRINGNCIDEESVVSYIKRIRKAELDFSPSFFEITFVMALDYFKKKTCDICILETGLGGRLDSTNIVIPLLSAVTNISLEHTHLLGETIEEIATEKGGIIKENIPVVLGKMHQDAQNVLEKIALNKNVKVYRSNHYNVPFVHTFFQENVDTAKTIMNAMKDNGFNSNDQDFINGLDNIRSNTGFFGRMQIVSENPMVIYDVSHNPDGIQKTMDAIVNIPFDQLHIVYGTSGDKDANAVVQLFPKTASLYFTEFSSERSMKADDLKLLNRNAMIFTSANNALNAAKEKAGSNDVILVTGSFFLLGDIVK